MRRFQKEMLLKNIGLLQEAGHTLAEQQPGAQKINLCADMQEFILAILNFSESVTEKNKELTDLLSEAYIMLLNASQEEVSAEKVIEQLEKAASFARDKVDIDKMEVVFFCPKASMSESLRDIYLDIKKYDTCDVYFVPVPYYDRNQDGSLGMMHYEAAGYYSDEFILTDWRTYDAEKQHPDIVFIADPYDEFNNMTTVHSDFYASHLKELADMLVYVHHGSSDEIADRDLNRLPGILLSDKVVVQSEDMRAQYIQLLTNQGVTAEAADKKVVTFDSLNIKL